MTTANYGQWPASPLRAFAIIDGANGANPVIKQNYGGMISTAVRTGAGIYTLVLTQDLGPINASWGLFIGLTTPDRFATSEFTQATNTLVITVSDAAGADADSATLSLLFLCGTPGAAA